MSSIGLFITSTPSNIPTPVANQTWVLNPTTGVLSFWNGTVWVQTSMLYNTNQTTDPTSSDNASAGWPLGSLWTNVVTRRTWISVDAGSTAHWEPIGWGSGRFNVVDGTGADFVASGLLPDLSGAATLSPTLPHGTYYIGGQQYDSANPLGSPATPAGAAFTVSGTEDTYFGIDESLSVSTQAVAAGAAAPSFAAGILPFLRIEGRALDTPAAPFLTFTSASGTLAAGTYTYTRTALNALGETIASATVAITTTATGSIILTWDTVDGEAGAKIYGRVSGSLGLLATVAAKTLTWTDSGSATVGAASPTTNTTNCARYAVPLTARPSLINGAPFDITRFGAVGDWTSSAGGTDNSAILQSVIKAAANVAAGAPGSVVEVVIPPGEYSLARTVVVLPGVRLTGEGVLVNTAQDIYKPFVRVQAGAELGDLVINANGSTGIQLGDPASPTTAPIRAGHIVVENVGTTAVVATGQEFVGVNAINAGGVLADNIMVTGGRQGLLLNGVSDCALQVVRLVNCQNGLQITGSQRVHVVTLDVETPVNTGVVVDGSNNVNINGVVWVNQATSGAAATTGAAVSWGPTTACDGAFGNLAIVDTGATALALDYVNAMDLSVTIGSGNFPGGKSLGITTGIDATANVGTHAVVRGVVTATTPATIASGAGLSLDIVANGVRQNTTGTLAVGGVTPVPATITTEGSASMTAQQTITPPTSSSNTYLVGSYTNVPCTGGINQFGSYYDLGSAQVNGKGGAIKISHYGLGDGMYIDLQNKGFGYEAASYYNGSTGFLASFQASDLTSSIGFEALWNYGTVPAYGLFYASQSSARAFVIQQNYVGNNGYPQIAIMTSDLGATVYGVNNDGTVQANVTNSSLAGTTAGTIDYAMPEQGTWKKFMAIAAGYENDTTTAQTITFPVAFTNTPIVTQNTSGLTVSVSTTTLTITAPDATTTYSGYIFVEGS